MKTLRNRLLRSLPASWRHILRTWNSVRQVRNFSASQWPEASLVQQFIRPGDVVVDAGANIGYISALLARWVGSSGRVHSIEPIPATYAVLQKAMKAMRLDQVQCHACGVSDRSGQALMEIPAYSDGVENFYESRIVSPGTCPSNGIPETVQLRTLDQVVGRDADRVTFIKMDVEGHEEPALRGAGYVLEQARPALLIEINGSLDEPDPATARLLSDLHGRGYGVYLSDGAGGVQPRQAGQRAVDYFFLTNQHIAGLKAPRAQEAL